MVGISHMTFIVKDLDRAKLFWEQVLGATEVYDSGDNPFSLSKEKFFLIQDLWVCIMAGEPLAQRTYNHIAFQIAEGDFEDYEKRIKAVGAVLKPPRPRVAGEGRSLYCYDFDNHLFELHTGSLEERLACYAKGKTITAP